MSALGLGTWGIWSCPCGLEPCHPPARQPPFYSLPQQPLHVTYLTHTTDTHIHTHANHISNTAERGKRQSWAASARGPIQKQKVIF